MTPPEQPSPAKGKAISGHGKRPLRDDPWRFAGNPLPRKKSGGWARTESRPRYGWQPWLCSDRALRWEPPSAVYPDARATRRPSLRRPASWHSWCVAC